MSMPIETGGHPIQVLEPVAAQQITTSGTSARSAQFDARTKALELYATEGCFVALGGASIDATSSDIFVAAGLLYYYSVASNTRIAAIQSSTGGTLYVNELG